MSQCMTECQMCVLKIPRKKKKSRIKKSHHTVYDRMPNVCVKKKYPEKKKVLSKEVLPYNV